VTRCRAKPTPLSDAPYKAHPDYNLTADLNLDLDANPCRVLADAQIPAYSIQFFRIPPVARPGGKVVVRVPKEWFEYKKPGRGVFLRSSVRQREPADFPVQEGAAELTAHTNKSEASFLYVVDTGQSGSTWFTNYSPALVYLLEPPANVQARANQRRLTVTWDLPALAKARPDLLAGYDVYLNDGREPVTRASPGQTSVELDLPEDPGLKRARVCMTTWDAGRPVALQSERSQSAETDVSIPAPTTYTVNFFVYRTRSSPVGSSKQTCPHYALRVLRAGRVLGERTSEQATDTNGLVELPLPVGKGFQYELSYRYTMPKKDEGKSSGTFEVLGDQEVQVDTASGTASVKVRAKAAPSRRLTPEELAKVGTAKQLALNGECKVDPDGFQGTSTCSISVAAPIALTPSGTLAEPQVTQGEKKGTGLTVRAQQGGGNVQVSGSASISFARTSYRRDPGWGDSYYEYTLKNVKYRRIVWTPKLEGQRIHGQGKTEEGASLAFTAPAGASFFGVSVYCVLEIEVVIRVRQSNVERDRATRTLELPIASVSSEP
jgi:hypothetical protein